MLMTQRLGVERYIPIMETITEIFVISQRQTLIYQKLGQIEKACKSYLRLWTNATRALGEKNAVAIQLGCHCRYPNGATSIRRSSQRLYTNLIIES